DGQTNCHQVAIHPAGRQRLLASLTLKEREGSRVTIVRRKWKHDLLLLNLRDPDGFLAEIDSRVVINHIKK
ncbi:MAG: hypothetical protein OSB29_11750, partial [Verrucomicrobiota bacterium]|nr:hypothetical protein [Verrucomicrobiota bacterium]